MGTVARIGGIIAAVFCGLLLLAFAFLFTQNLSPFARQLEAKLSAEFGREVLIGGDVRLRLSPQPTLSLGSVFVGNVDGGAVSHFLLAERLDARFGLSGLLPPKVVVEQVSLEGARVNLEKVPGGGASWKLVSPVSDEARKPDSLLFALPKLIIATRVGVEINGLIADELGPLGVERVLISETSKDQYRLMVESVGLGGRTRLDANILGVSALWQNGAFEILGQATNNNFSALFSGAGNTGSGAHFKLSGSGSIADIAMLIDLKNKQDVAPGEFNFDLETDGTLGTVQLTFDKLGTGDLAINGAWTHGEEFVLTGQANAQVLDLDVLLPRSLKAPSGERLISKQAWPVETLRRLRLDLDATAENVIWGGRSLGTFELGIWATNGILVLGPARLVGDDVDIAADVILDARTEPRLTLTMQVKLRDLGVLPPSLGVSSTQRGRVDWAIELAGVGESPRAVLANATGQTNLLVSSVELEPWLVTALLGGSFSATIPLGDGLKPLPVRCIINRFDIEQGLATSRALLIDTPTSVITGSGKINLKTEQIQFELTPRPRDPALMGQARDIAVKGALVSPVFEHQDRNAARGLSRVSARVVMSDGFNALLPFIDLEAALTNDCVRTLLGETTIAQMEADVAEHITSIEELEIP